MAVAKPLPPPVPLLCLTPIQRQHLADSQETLSKTRVAFLLMRQVADTSQRGATKARRSAHSFASALVVQQQMTNAMVVESNNWKHKARRRGLLNWIYTALVISAASLYLKP